MPTLDDVAAVLEPLPGVTPGERDDRRHWLLEGKGFAWERAFSKADIRRFGDAPVPEAPILAVRVADLVEKEAILAANEAGVFTIPHFDGYAAVLICLPEVSSDTLREILTDAWHTQNPGQPRNPGSA